MYRSAAIRRPLRSKREMISPVRLRAKASGFTRIRVRSIVSPVYSLSARGTRRRLGHGVLGRRGATAAPAAARGGRSRPGLGLAVGAQAPGGVDRLTARVAALLEPAHAAGAAQVVGLDLVLAVRAELVVELHQAGFGGLHLELAQAHVVEVLRRP